MAGEQHHHERDRFGPQRAVGWFIATRVMCRFLLSSLAFCFLLSRGMAEDQGAPEPPVASDGTAEYVKERETAQRNFWTKRMAAERKWLARAVALSPEQSASLAGFAEEAVRKAMEEWSRAAEQIADDFRHAPEAAGLPPLEVLMESWNDALASRVFGQYRAPEEQPAWRAGLAGLLTPAQAETWKKQAPARAAALLKPFLKQGKEVQEDYRESAGALLDQESTNLALVFELDEAQHDKIEALARRLVNRRLAEWRTEAARCLADQAPDEGAAAGGELSLPEPRPVTPHDGGWLEGLRKVLDAPTWRSLADSMRASEARQPKALAQILVLAVDEEVRCTARQRAQLVPLAERWVQAQRDLFQENHRDGLTMANFLAAAARATPEELGGVLEESQLRAWRRACVPGILDEVGALVLRPARAPGQLEPPPAPLPSGGRPEDLLQAFLLREEAKVRKLCLVRAVGRAQEIGRVCALPDETRALLQTAARGAVEASLREWRGAAESSTREQIDDLDDQSAEALRGQLEQMDDLGTLNALQTPPDKQPVWTRTLKKVMQALPSPQAEAWRQEEAARAAFKRQAIVRFVLEDFNRLIYLTSQQVAKIEPLLDEAVKAGAEELEQRSSTEAPWYLAAPGNLYPLNLIPEAKLRPLLTAQQWSGWTASEAYAAPEGKK
jgi:hypothetical protein